MSIVAMKRKSVIQFGSKVSGQSPGGNWVTPGPFGATGFMGNGEPYANNSGFSVNGPYRNIGGVGKTMHFSKRGTPFRGTQPRGSGGQDGTYNTTGNIFYNVNEVNVLATQKDYVKPSVLSNYGMLERKYKWIHGGTQPNIVVKNIFNSGNLSDTKSQEQYIKNLSAANQCEMDINNSAKYENNIYKCNTFCNTLIKNNNTPTSGGKYDTIARKAPYTKNTKTQLDYDTYIRLKQKQCSVNMINAGACNVVCPHTPVATNGNGAPNTTPSAIYGNTRAPTAEVPDPPTLFDVIVNTDPH